MLQTAHVIKTTRPDIAVPYKVMDHTWVMYIYVAILQDQEKGEVTVKKSEHLAEFIKKL